MYLYKTNEIDVTHYFHDNCIYKFDIDYVIRVPYPKNHKTPLNQTNSTNSFYTK